MGCFPVDFQEVKRPLGMKSVKRPIKVLVALQTQTQNRRVLATQFPKSHPCPRWQL